MFFFQFHLFLLLKTMNHVITIWVTSSDDASIVDFNEPVQDVMKVNIASKCNLNRVKYVYKPALMTATQGTVWGRRPSVRHIDLVFFQYSGWQMNAYLYKNFNASFFYLAWPVMTCFQQCQQSKLTADLTAPFVRPANDVGVKNENLPLSTTDGTSVHPNMSASSTRSTVRSSAKLSRFVIVCFSFNFVLFAIYLFVWTCRHHCCYSSMDEWLSPNALSYWQHVINLFCKCCKELMNSVREHSELPDFYLQPINFWHANFLAITATEKLAITWFL